MKNISFKRKESVIRGLEIQKGKNDKRNPRNWDRIIYLSLLVILLFFLLRYLYFTFFFIEANGEIRFDSISIRNTDDCRVVEFYVEEGDMVCIGDSLFSFYPDKPEGSFNQFGSYEFAMNQQTQGDISWAEKELFKTRSKVSINKSEIAEKERLKQVLESELERIRHEVMLEVLPRSKYDNQVEDINKLNSEIEIIKGENALLISSLAKLQNMKRDLGSNTFVDSNGDGISDDGETNLNRVFYSPIEGTVTEILKNDFEVALKDEVILTIHRPENVYIKGFFDQEYLNDLAVNDVVEIEFPDGTNGLGVIKRFYFTTYELPDEFQKKYEPTTRSLSADIYPIDEQELFKWRTFWKMGVKITKRK